MENRIIPASELIINGDGSIFHLHILPEDLADVVFLFGDQGRVEMASQYLDTIELHKSSREFNTMTGTYHGKRVTLLSTGIGTDNIDIVMTELDALANIDFATRTRKAEHRSLKILRVGTCGAIQKDLNLGDYIFSEMSVGFDGLLNWYAGVNDITEFDYEVAFMEHMDWPDRLPTPYFVRASNEISSLFDGIAVKGITMSAPGFYGPQGRYVSLEPLFPNLTKDLESFSYNGMRITNIEMESSALAGLAALLGHKAGTVCLAIANRYAKESNPDYKKLMSELLKTVLDRMTL